MSESEGLNGLTEKVIRAAIDVHRALGPGLLESTHEACLAVELENTGMRVARQVALPVSYRGLRLETGYRVDMIVEGRVLLELKAVEHTEKVHEAQLLTYLKLSGLTPLINFNVPLLKDGIKRMVHGLNE